MGDVVTSVEEDGNLKVVKHYNLRFLFRRMRGDALQRRPVVRWWNCRQNCQDDTFMLKCAFVFTLLCALIRTVYELFITNTLHVPRVLHMFHRSGISLSYQLLWDGILLAAMFTAVFALWLLMKVRMTAPSSQKEEIKSISGLVQHL